MLNFALCLAVFTVIGSDFQTVLFGRLTKACPVPSGKVTVLICVLLQFIESVSSLLDV